MEQSLAVQDYPIYGPDLYNATKSFILPSVIFVKLGLDALSAVRIVSSLYALLTLIFAGLTLIRIKSRNITSFHENMSLISNKEITLLFILTFMPSNFIWSILGLRESASQFWLLTALYFSIRSQTEDAKVEKHISTLIAIIALIFAFGSRPQTALVFTFAAGMISILVLIRFKKVHLLIGVLVALVGGQLFTMTPEVSTKYVVKPIEISKIESKLVNEMVTSNPTNTSRLETSEIEIIPGCKAEGEELIEDNVVKVCVKTEIKERHLNNPFDRTKSSVETIKSFESRREANQQGADSVIRGLDCLQTKSRYGYFANLGCTFLDTTYRAFTFLFRPLPIIDQGSKSLRAASLENIVWIVFFFYLVTMTLRTKRVIINPTFLFLAIYLSTFVAAASQYEGNLGTAFRHKSSILWVTVVMLFIVNSERLNGSSKKSS